MSHAFIKIINIAKLKNRTTKKRHFLLQAIQSWPQRDKCIQGPYSHADTMNIMNATLQHPPIIAEREDNEENYHLTNISYKWDLNLRSDPDNGSDIFHGGSLQTNDRKDWQWLLCTGLNGTYIEVELAKLHYLLFLIWYNKGFVWNQSTYS